MAAPTDPDRANHTSQPHVASRPCPPSLSPTKPSPGGTPVISTWSPVSWRIQRDLEGLLSPIDASAPRNPAGELFLYLFSARCGSLCALFRVGCCDCEVRITVPSFLASLPPSSLFHSLNSYKNRYYAARIMVHATLTREPRDVGAGARCGYGHILDTKKWNVPKKCPKCVVSPNMYKM